MEIYDDDSENDSDYSPDQEVVDNEKMTLIALNIKDTIKSSSSKRKVNLIWNEMQLDEENHLKNSKRRLESAGLSFRADEKENGNVKRNLSSDNQRLLASIFGKSEAQKLYGSFTSRSDFEDCVDKDKNNIRELALESVKRIKKKVKITEKKKFAGAEIMFDIYLLVHYELFEYALIIELKRLL